MDARNLPEIPPGPADVTFPRRALSRLALSSASAETAEVASGHVPTDADGDAYQVVEYAAVLVSSARYVLTRAVVHAREIGGSWADIAEALCVSEREARERYGEEIERWEDALDRPWARSGSFLVSRMPGDADPAWTVAYLDGWCSRHIPEDDSARSLARDAGTEDRMVSASLPKHTAVTEMTSVVRYGQYLLDHDVLSGPDWEAHQARRADVYARAEAEMRGGSAP
jgi:hypothetical protein